MPTMYDNNVATISFKCKKILKLNIFWIFLFILIQIGVILPDDVCS